jgi:hypothetical protein
LASILGNRKQIMNHNWTFNCGCNDMLTMIMIMIDVNMSDKFEFGDSRERIIIRES